MASDTVLKISKQNGSGTYITHREIIYFLLPKRLASFFSFIKLVTKNISSLIYIIRT